MLRYDKGELQQAITRGAEGRIGEDVTHTVRNMTNVPLKVPYDKPFEVRGEGVMTWENFNAVNETLEEPYSHPRGLAAGNTRRHNADKARSIPVDFIVFELVSDEGVFKHKHQQFQFLMGLGFEVVNHQIIGDSANPAQIQNVMGCFVPEKYSYPVDGLIIEHDDLDYGKSLGVTGHHENRLLAFKWADETYETMFLGLEVATTRTGMISLTGMFDDVVIDGTVVNRAYLHNANIVESLQLGIGDKVTLYKANKIIPQVAENLTKSGTLELPKACPCCGALAETRVSLLGTRFLYCSNKSCPAKVVQMFNHFCSKTRMNIEGMSAKTLDKLIGAGYVKTFADLFSLEQHGVAIARLPGFGPGKVKNMVDAAEKARHCKLNQFLAGLGIHTVGRTASRTISQYFRGDWNAFEQAIQNGFDFTQLDDFGETMHNNVYAWYADKEREKLWRPALQHIEFEKDEENTIMTENNSFAGKTVVATGKLENFTRDGIQMKLLSLGAKPGSSVSSKTDFLIVGEGAGGKLAKARQHGVKTISEREFLSMLPDGDPDFTTD